VPDSPETLGPLSHLRPPKVVPAYRPWCKARSIQSELQVRPPAEHLSGIKACLGHSVSDLGSLWGPQPWQFSPG